MLLDRRQAQLHTAIGICLLQALAYAALADRLHAFVSLEQALALAEREG